MDRHQQLPQPLMVLIALIQGLSLLYLHQAIELDYWPNKQPQWLFAFYSVALILPITMLLGLRTSSALALAKYAVPFALICGGLGYYVGSQAIPLEYIRYQNLLFAYVFTMVLATFKALMYMQQQVSGEPFSYAALFRWSWRNFLTLALSLLFAGCVWLILILWGQLFKAIGINAFKETFEQPWFYYPAIALANGFGIIIFRRLTHIIDTITRLQQALMKFLLVIIVFVSILFLFALPFTGLAPLWQNGGSLLILWMQALMLFFVNAVYQDDAEQRPYPIWIHRFIYAGVILLPVYSAISFYGLTLRVAQYGWTLDRCWGFAIWFMLALFPLGYAWGIIKQRDNWVRQLSRVNVAVGLVFLALMLLVNSPLLDFRRIVVNNQLDRVATGTSKIEKLDIHYFRRQLGKPGYDALIELKTKYADTHPALVVRIANLYRSYDDKQPPGTTKDDFFAIVDVLAPNVPQTLLDEIYKNETKNGWNLQYVQGYYLQSLDLNTDGQDDYLLAEERDKNISLELYYFEESEWKNKRLNNVYLKEGEDRQAFVDSLRASEISIEIPKWKHFEINGKRFGVSGFE